MKTFDVEIKLIGLEDGVDDDGFHFSQEVIKPGILANELSIHSTDHWNANREGIKLAKAFEVHDFEYSGEEKLIFNDKKYKIERTYDKGDLIELICAKFGDEHVL